MGLNIGIHASVYSGEEPKLPSPEEVEEEFFAFLREKFPKGGFGGGWVKRRETRRDGLLFVEWDFDVRMFGYGAEFENNGYPRDAMYVAIFEFILPRFHTDQDVDLNVYWSG